MATTYSKINGRSKGYRYRNSIVDLQRDLYKRNEKMTPQELGLDEKFEDHPNGDSDRYIGKVVKQPTSNLHHARKSSTFDNF